MHISAVGKSDVGKERELNEDSFLCDPALSLFVVVGSSGTFTSIRPGRLRSTSIRSGREVARIQTTRPRFDASLISCAIIE